jgi:hypothetical protein
VAWRYPSRLAFHSLSSYQDPTVGNSRNQTFISHHL